MSKAEPSQTTEETHNRCMTIGEGQHLVDQFVNERIALQLSPFSP